MSIIPTHLMHGTQKLLDLISKRQEAISDNIANMHTAGYKRKDVNFSQYINNSTGSNLENKITEKYGSAPIGNLTTDEQKSAEDELAIMQENYMLYNVAVKQLSSTVTQIKTALNVSANG